MATARKKKITAYSQDGWYYFYGPAARQVNKLVGVALTTEHKGGKKLDLAGFPINSGPDFIGQLLDAGAEIDIKPMSARGSVSKWRNPGRGTKTKSIISIRSHTYQGKPGYLVSGRDAMRRQISIHVPDRSQAEAIKKAIKENASQDEIGRLIMLKNPRARNAAINKSDIQTFKDAKGWGFSVPSTIHPKKRSKSIKRWKSERSARQAALREYGLEDTATKNPRVRNTTIIKARKIGKVIIRRRASVANPYAYQVQYQRPGEKVEYAGAYYTNSRQNALAQAEADLKRRRIWKAKTKLITGAVPLNSTAAKHKNSTDTPCFYCGGPGGQLPGWDHSTSCHRYRKPPGRKVKTIGRKRKAPIKNPFYIFQGHVDGGDYYRITDSRNSDFKEWPTLAAAKEFVEAEKKKAREWVYFSIKRKDGRGDYKEVYKTETGGGRRNPARNIPAYLQNEKTRKAPAEWQARHSINDFWEIHYRREKPRSLNDSDNVSRETFTEDYQLQNFLYERFGKRFSDSVMKKLKTVKPGTWIGNAKKALSQINPATSKTRQIRETFTGQASNKTANKYAPDGTPAELAKLGNLVSIKTEKGLIVPAGSGAVWLCSDSKGRFHICTDGSRLIDGPARSFGQILKIEYEATKPHLGFKKPTVFYHKLAEEGGRHPELITDGKGGLKIKGGTYYITAEGIRD